MMVWEYGRGMSALVVDQGPGVRRTVELLENAGFAVAKAASAEEARGLRAERVFDLLVIDESLPDAPGVELAKRCREVDDDFEVVLTTEHPNVETAIAALRLGAGDYLPKPLAQSEPIHERLYELVERLRFRRHERALVAELHDRNTHLEDLVVRDGLTGLYNHAYFQERLEAEIARSGRGGHHLGLLFIDLDRFKAVNDSVGHPVGDAILKSLAEMLRSAHRDRRYGFRIREHDFAARYGGDEFVLLLPETTKGGAAVTAERLRRHVATRTLGRPGTRVTVSIGVAAYPNDGQSRESLLAAADAALYAAKRLGRNRVVTYTPVLAGEPPAPAIPAIPKERLSAVERSLTGHAFQFVYQPIASTAGFELFGYEALCRPRDPQLGSITDTLVAAEHVGKMVELGRILREQAVAPLGALDPRLLLFVNLHPHELTDAALALHGTSLRRWANRVVLEISETVAIKDYEMTRRIVRELHEAGFRVALDDLGAGYAGLHALAQIEADFVKLDRSLVRNIHEGGRTPRLIKHVLEYAQSEGITVIAEGVEKQAEWEVVRALGCPLVQGFLVGAPEPTFTPPIGVANDEETERDADPPAAAGTAKTRGA